MSKFQLWHWIIVLVVIDDLRDAETVTANGSNRRQNPTFARATKSKPSSSQ